MALGLEAEGVSVGFYGHEFSTKHFNSSLSLCDLLWVEV